MGGTIFTILTIAYTLFGLMFYEWRVMTFIDEGFALLFAFYAVARMVFHRIPTYKPLIIFLGIDLFYLAYSLLIGSNVNIAIFNDIVMQSKPYLMFFGLLALRPQLENVHFEFIKLFALTCFPLMCVIYVLYPHWREGTYTGELLTGAAFSSVALLVGTLFYISCKKDSWINRCTVLCLMALGFLDPTSKFLGTIFMSIIIMVFVSKPLKISIKLLVGVAALIVCLVAITWNDIVFYFMTNSDLNARPVLYATAPAIMNDYIPFGSGFASFANATSANWYSPIYAKYNIENIWGLAEGEAMFVSDTYYPVLAQFGYVGVALFVSWFVYIFKTANRVYSKYEDLKRYKVTLIIVAFVLIEATTGSFTNERCILAMILLALSLYKYEPQSRTRIEDSFGLENIHIHHDQTKQDKDAQS